MEHAEEAIWCLKISTHHTSPTRNDTKYEALIEVRQRTLVHEFQPQVMPLISSFPVLETFTSSRTNSPGHLPNLALTLEPSYVNGEIQVGLSIFQIISPRLRYTKCFVLT